MGVVALGVSARLARAQTPELWRDLPAGTQAVGFVARVIHDSTRSVGAHWPRPVPVSIWYPSAPGAPMTFARYVAWYERGVAPLVPRDTLAADIVRDYAKARFPEQALGAVRRLLDVPTGAVLNGAPAQGRFPVIVYVPGYGGTPLTHTVTCELLASRGFIVASHIATSRRRIVLDECDGTMIARHMDAQGEATRRPPHTLARVPLTLRCVTRPHHAYAVTSRRPTVTSRRSAAKCSFSKVSSPLADLTSRVSIATHPGFESRLRSTEMRLRLSEVRTHSAKVGPRLFEVSRRLTEVRKRLTLAKCRSTAVNRSLSDMMSRRSTSASHLTERRRVRAACTRQRAATTAARVGRTRARSPPASRRSIGAAHRETNQSLRSGIRSMRGSATSSPSSRARRLPSVTPPRESC
jgi:hypothetical protein